MFSNIKNIFNRSICNNMSLTSIDVEAFGIVSNIKEAKAYVMTTSCICRLDSVIAVRINGIQQKFYTYKDLSKLDLDIIDLGILFNKLLGDKKLFIIDLSGFSYESVFSLMNKAKDISLSRGTTFIFLLNELSSNYEDNYALNEITDVFLDSFKIRING